MTTVILGAGITGLAAGYHTGFPVFEARGFSGGLCATYYRKPRHTGRYYELPDGGDAYRFETGGGHWIFGADEEILKFLRTLVMLGRYQKQTAVHFCRYGLSIPCPIQHHLNFFDEQAKTAILKQMKSGASGTGTTMKEWMANHFGPLLCGCFFDPFNHVYTAGLYDRIAPHDHYKSPAQRLSGWKRNTGYNAVFFYPNKGLGALVRALTAGCRVFYHKRALKIDTKRRVIYFADNSFVGYQQLISTLPLNVMLEISGLAINERTDPYTSLLVLNIGAVRGRRCPREHWLYMPDAESGFFRIGFYSNVDTSFLPRSSRQSNNRISIYVERAFKGGEEPSCQEKARYGTAVIKELQRMGFIDEVVVMDADWIDVAYTWSWPNSSWREKAIVRLEEKNIYPIGRYGRWKFQGIVESVKEGLSLTG